MPQLLKNVMTFKTINQSQESVLKECVASISPTGKQRDQAKGNKVWLMEDYKISSDIYREI